MDTTTAIFLVIALFALLTIAVLLRFRHQGDGEIQGPFGTKFRFRGSNQPEISKGVRAKGITSKKGGVLVDEALGAGVDVENIKAQDDVLISSGSQAKDDRPK